MEVNSHINDDFEFRRFFLNIVTFCAGSSIENHCTVLGFIMSHFDFFTVK
jgi:hypothetical protein